MNLVLVLSIARLINQQLITFLLLGTFVAFPFEIEAQQIHAILVSDTSDPSIGDGCQRNHDFMIEKLRMIANKADLTFKLTEITDYQVNTKKILGVINKLKVDQNDVVWFYYSGHGINSSKDRWPRLLIPGRQKLPLSDLHEQLKSKDPRLLLTIGDCCNFTINGVPLEAGLSSKAPFLSENCERLFKEASGAILASGSSPNQASNYFDNIGGIFTSSLIDALKESLQGENGDKADWGAVFQRSVQLTRDLATVFDKPQKPQFIGTEQILYEPILANFNNVYASESLLKETNNLDQVQHKVKAGETLNKIAKKYLNKYKKPIIDFDINQLVNKIAFWSELEEIDDLDIGDVLIIQRPFIESLHTEDEELIKREPFVHIVRKGDTLEKIGKNYLNAYGLLNKVDIDILVDEIAKWNNIKKNSHIELNQKLIIKRNYFLK